MWVLPQAAVIHELFQHGSLLHNAVSSAQCSHSGGSYSCVGALHGHRFCQQTWSSVDSPLHGFTGPALSVLLPYFHGIPMGSQQSLGISLIQWGPSWATEESLLHHKPLWTLSRQPASPWSSLGVNLKKLVIWRNSWRLEKGKYYSHL